MSSQSLAVLPVEVLSVITSYLQFVRSNYYLYCTGNAVLRHKLAHGGITLLFWTVVNLKPISFASELRQLVSVNIITTNESTVVTQLIQQHLPPTILHLRVYGPICDKILTFDISPLENISDDYSTPIALGIHRPWLIKRSFPHLETLHLESTSESQWSSTPFARIAFMVGLPSSITDLDLYYFSEPEFDIWRFMPQNVVRIGMVTNSLPAPIHRFRLSQVTTMTLKLSPEWRLLADSPVFLSDDEKVREISLLDFATEAEAEPALKQSLYNYRLIRAPYYPPSLTKLALKGRRAAQNLPILLSSLPPTVNYLELYATPTSEVLRLIPSHVSWLEFTGVYDERSREKVMELFNVPMPQLLGLTWYPKGEPQINLNTTFKLLPNLIHLHLIGEKIPTLRLEDLKLLEHLISLRGVFDPSCFKSDASGSYPMQSLLPNLRSLHVQTSSIESFAAIPRKVSLLQIAPKTNCTPKSLHLLPPTLSQLEVRSMRIVIEPNSYTREPPCDTDPSEYFNHAERLMIPTDCRLGRDMVKSLETGESLPRFYLVPELVPEDAAESPTSSRLNNSEKSLKVTITKPPTSPIRVNWIDKLCFMPRLKSLKLGDEALPPSILRSITPENFPMLEELDLNMQTMLLGQVKLIPFGQFLTLKTLKLYGCHASLFAFPPHLTSLIVQTKLVVDSTRRPLPAASLTLLTCEYLEPFSCVSDLQVLTVFKCHSARTSDLAYLPRSIKTLCLPFNVIGDLKADQFDQLEEIIPVQSSDSLILSIGDLISGYRRLPSTVSKIDLDLGAVDTQHLLNLIIRAGCKPKELVLEQSVQSFVFKQFRRIFPLVSQRPMLGEFINALPTIAAYLSPETQDLRLSVNPLSYLSGLPPSLTRLQIDMIRTRAVSICPSLPKTLVSLIAPKVFFKIADIASFPVRMTHLEFYKVADWEDASTKIVWPPALTHLAIEDERIVAEAHLQALPHTLRYLDLKRLSLKENVYSHLPPHLRYLRCLFVNSDDFESFELSAPVGLTWIDPARAGMPENWTNTYRPSYLSHTVNCLSSSIDTKTCAKQR